MLLLASAQLLLAGSRLGAIQDVVLLDRFEADPGPDADVEPLRDNLAKPEWRVEMVVTAAL